MTRHAPGGGTGPGTGRVTRRGLLGGAAGAAGGAALAAGAGLAMARDDTTTPDEGDLRYSADGAHQAGILTPVQRHACYLAGDVTTDRDGLRRLLDTLTARIRALTAGGPVGDDGLVRTAADNGILGDDLPTAGLTITVSVGASLFDHRFGLAPRRPARLVPMPAFADDALDPAWCGGDLLVQVCADEPDVVVHAVRDLLRATRGDLQVRWRRDGFTSPPRPSGTPRNLLGFKDGTANPDVSDDALMDRLVWTHAGGGEPDWVEGGSYHVVRLIRMFVEFWDRVSVREQNAIFGRDKSSGAPLTGTDEFDPPDYTGQSGGAIRLDAHIRRASRSGTAPDQRILRRGFNYDAGLDAAGDLDMGLIFTCFNADLERQFAAIQRRLEGEALSDYVSPFGGGFYFALPGLGSGEGGWARALLGT